MSFIYALSGKYLRRKRTQGNNHIRNIVEWCSYFYLLSYPYSKMMGELLADKLLSLNLIWIANIDEFNFRYDILYMLQLKFKFFDSVDSSCHPLHLSIECSLSAKLNLIYKICVIDFAYYFVNIQLC